MLARFDLDPAKVFTVHSGLSDTVSAALERRRGDEVSRTSRRPMCSWRRLSTDSRITRGSSAPLRNSFSRARCPTELVLAGGDADVTAADLAALAANEGVAERVKLLGAVTHDRVPDLIAGADAIAYTSLCESFGHPILEALAYGRCLVTSAATSMPEDRG